MFETSRLLYKFNTLPIWRRDVNVWGGLYHGPTFDRLLYLWLHSFSFRGRRQRGFAKTHIRPGMYVVDVGANVGLYTVLFSTLVGSGGQVAAFEPLPLLFNTLERNCSRNRVANARLHNLALGEQESQAWLSCCSYNSGDNSLCRVGSQEDSVRTPVRVASFDAVEPGATVDFIKIDVQGWELGVLKGMRKTLERSGEVIIYFEFWPCGLKASGTEPSELLAYLNGLGFRVYREESFGGEELRDMDRLVQNMGGNEYINVVAERK